MGVNGLHSHEEKSGDGTGEASQNTSQDASQSVSRDVSQATGTQQTLLGAKESAADAGPFQVAQELARALAPAGQKLRVECGERLFSLGEVAEGAYLVVSGSARAWLPDDAGRELMCVPVAPGAVLGLTAALCSNQYQFHVDAAETLETVFLASETVNEILRERPELCLQAMGMMCNELASLRQTRDHMQCCGNKACSLHGSCTRAD